MAALLPLDAKWSVPKHVYLVQLPDHVQRMSKGIKLQTCVVILSLDLIRDLPNDPNLTEGND